MVVTVSCRIVTMTSNKCLASIADVKFGMSSREEMLGRHEEEQQDNSLAKLMVVPVTFGETGENYRTEYIKFEVADFKTSYHAILGRPAITKFMAVPHYTYLVLKMPSLAGVFSLQGDLKISFDCDIEAVELAATNQVPNTMMEIYAASKKLAPSEQDIPEKSNKANKPQPSEEVQVKAIDLGTGDSSKTTMIWVGLDPK
jgi:hypothetical protein